MENYFGILQNVILFKGIESSNLSSMLSCLGGRLKNIKKDEFALMAGDKAENVGIVLDGQLHIARENADGERTLLAALLPGDFFGETLCCAGVKESPVSVLAVTNSTILLLAFSRILNTCPSSCGFHSKLIENMLFIIAQKNLHLQARMDFLSHKSIRSRLMSYLESSVKNHGQEFTIPLNREEMADFLCIDRSALSRELSRLKQEGIIDYRKNRFILL